MRRTCPIYPWKSSRCLARRSSSGARHDRAALVFSVLTHFWACNPGTPWWRKRELVTDICYWFFVPLFGRVLRIGLLVVGAGVFFKIYDADDLMPFTTMAMARVRVAAMASGGVVPGAVGLHAVLLHRMFHRGGFWKYHAIHHSSEDLDWISRHASTGEPVSGNHPGRRDIAAGGISPERHALGRAVQHVHSAFVHANLSWTLGPFKYVLATPVFHRWHHTSLAEGGNTNFAGTSALGYSVRTYRMPKMSCPIIMASTTS